MIWDVIIVGAGPAGLSAGAELKDKKVLILEKMPEVGKKLLLSGAGQCNLTHGGEISEYKECYGPHWRFIRPALTGYSNVDFIEDLQKVGLTVRTLENGKVFPTSMKASDVVQALLRRVQHCKIQTGADVKSIEKQAHWEVKTDTAFYHSKYLIIATGGMTYTNTGSTGDGYDFARSLGIEIVTPRFGLAPVYIKDFHMSSLMGLSFENLTIEHYRQKKIGSYTGDLLLTHFGLSGPVILNHSRYMRRGDTIKVAFLQMESHVLDQWLIQAMAKEGKKQIKTILRALPLQERLLSQLLSSIGIESTMKGSELSKEMRKQVVKALTASSFEVAQVGKSHIAMVTTGGISKNALNKKTYASKEDETLHFVGECVDVDGDTGGYNIQFAVSSGTMAGRHIMEVSNEKM